MPGEYQPRIRYALLDLDDVLDYQSDYNTVCHAQVPEATPYIILISQTG